MEKIFVYGTLRNRELRKKLSGRDIPAITLDKLKGFDLSSITDDDGSYPIIIENQLSEQVITGEILELSQKELVLFDQYEGPLYRRAIVLLESGRKAWVYIQ